VLPRTAKQDFLYGNGKSTFSGLKFPYEIDRLNGGFSLIEIILIYEYQWVIFYKGAGPMSLLVRKYRWILGD